MAFPAPDGIVPNPGETPRQTYDRYLADYHSPDRDQVLDDLSIWVDRAVYFYGPAPVVQLPTETAQQCQARYVADYHSPDREAVLASLAAWIAGGTELVDAGACPFGGQALAEAPPAMLLRFQADYHAPDAPVVLAALGTWQRGAQHAFPAVPDRDTLLLGKLTGQGLYVSLDRFGGAFPWWPPVWPWLTKEERASVAKQLLAQGEVLTCVEVPCGPALYDEPAPNFYRPDNGFGPLDWTNGNTALDPQFVALLVELLEYGFKGIWIFLGGDAGQAGVPIAMAQTALIGPALAACPKGNLNEYVVQFPGWDGVWHKPDGTVPVGTGWTPEQVEAWGDAAIAAGAVYVGLEHANGYLPVGEGGGDFQPGGRLFKFSIILGEFDGPNPYTKDSWQILGRMSRPYVKMPSQGSDDPNPPYYLGGLNAQGYPFRYRVWEYDMYGHVRGTPPTVVAAERQVFVDTGAPFVC